MAISIKAKEGFIAWTGFFFLDQKVQLVINRNDNKKRNIKTKILQDSPVSPIFFLLYITKVFNKIFDISPVATSLSFVDDLCFIFLKSFVKKLVKILENIAKKIIKQEKQNAVTYNISKTEAILF